MSIDLEALANRLHGRIQSSDYGDSDVVRVDVEDARALLTLVRQAQAAQQGAKADVAGSMIQQFHQIYDRVSDPAERKRLYAEMTPSSAQDTYRAALERIAAGVENGQSFSGTDCADIARAAIKSVGGGE